MNNTDEMKANIEKAAKKMQRALKACYRYKGRSELKREELRKKLQKANKEWEAAYHKHWFYTVQQPALQQLHNYIEQKTLESFNVTTK